MYKKTLTESLEKLRKELAESYSNETELKIKKIEKDHENEKITILRDLKNVTEEEHSLSKKELIENFWKQSRETLEMQRLQLEEERLSEIEKSKKEFILLVEKHENEKKIIKTENENEVKRLLNDLKLEMNEKYENSVKEKEKAAERALEEATANLRIEKESAVSNLKSSHVRYYYYYYDYYYYYYYYYYYCYYSYRYYYYHYYYLRCYRFFTLETKRSSPICHDLI